MRSAFISFAERSDPDRAVFLYLAERLRSIGVTTWTYLLRGSRLRSGVPVAESCRIRARQADIFVGVVSPASLVSRFCAAEFEAADPDRFDRHGALAFAVVLGQATSMPVEGPFGWASRRITEVVVESWGGPGGGDAAPTSLVVAADRIVAEVQRRFPLEVVDEEPIPSLPLYSRLKAELLLPTPGWSELEGAWPLVAPCARRVLSKLVEGDTDAALKEAQKIGVLVEAVEPAAANRLFYSEVTVGVLHLEAADRASDHRAWAGRLELARERFEHAVAVSIDYQGSGPEPRRREGPFDENGLAGLALTLLKRDDDGDARRARELIADARAVGKSDDPALLYFLLLSYVRGPREDLADLLHEEYPEGFWEPAGYEFATEPADAIRVGAVRAAAQALLGKVDAVEGGFVCESAEVDPSALSDAHDAVMLFVDAAASGPVEADRGRSLACAEMVARKHVRGLALRTGGGLHETERLCQARHRLARTLLEQGRWREADAEYTRLLALDPRFPQFLAEVGLAAELGGRRRAARRYYQAADASVGSVGDGVFWGDRERAAGYYRGYAAWRLGDRPRARRIEAELPPPTVAFPRYADLDRRLGLD